VRQVAYVPDAGHARLIELAHADRAMRAIPLTTEEEGVALLAGAWLGGTISTEDALKSIWLAFTALFLAVKANRMINGK